MNSARLEQPPEKAPSLSEIWRRASRTLGSFSGSAILLLLLAVGVLWGVWRLDVTVADTASYFRTATEWSRHGYSTRDQQAAFSPLYCAFLGLCQRAFADAGDAVTFHRVIIVLFTAVMILATLRRILPRAWAWIGAAWWVA